MLATSEHVTKNAERKTETAYEGKQVKVHSGWFWFLGVLVHRVIG